MGKIDDYKEISETFSKVLKKYDEVWNDENFMKARAFIYDEIIRLKIEEYEVSSREISYEDVIDIFEEMDNRDILSFNINDIDKDRFSIDFAGSIIEDIEREDGPFYDVRLNRWFDGYDKPIKIIRDSDSLPFFDPTYYAIL